MNTTTVDSNSNPRAAFNITLCGITSMMAALYVLAASLAPVDLIQSSIVVYIIVALVAIGAIFLSSMTSNSWVSLISALVIPLALGAISAAEFAAIPSESLGEILTLLTINAVVVFGLSTAFPNFFKKMYSVLIVALIALIVVGLMSAFFFEINMTMYHYATIVIFSGFLGYDFVKAREVEPTLRNAISLSISAFLDLLNLFLAYAGLDD